MSQEPLSRHDQTFNILLSAQQLLHDDTSTTTVGHRERPAIGFGKDRLFAPAQLLDLKEPKLITSSPMHGLSSRSRTDVRMSIMSARPALHQRVHDADDAMFMHDPAKRFGGYYDPKTSTVFQHGLVERELERRNPKQARDLVRRAMAAAEATSDAGMANDVLRTVARVFKAWPAGIKRNPARDSEQMAGSIPPEVLFQLRLLVRSAAVIMPRRLALPALTSNSKKRTVGRDQDQGGGKGKQQGRQQLPRPRAVARKKA
jgi:hypothetical protein